MPLLLHKCCYSSKNTKNAEKEDGQSGVLYIRTTGFGWFVHEVKKKHASLIWTQSNLKLLSSKKWTGMQVFQEEVS